MSSQDTIPPPKQLLRFLRWFCDPAMLEDVEGDVVELFNERAQVNKIRARALFALDILFLFRPGIVRNLSPKLKINNGVMFKNHLKTAIRYASLNKGYTLINMLGLVVGIASCLLMLLWINDEISMDRFHAKSDRIYKVWRNMYQASGEVNTTPGIPQPLEFVLKSEYPEIEHVALLGWEIENLFRIEENSAYKIGRYASPEFFEIFSYEILAGDKRTMLSDLSSVVISESTALQFFGSDWRETAIGQPIHVDERKDYTVTGVFKDPGSDSSLDFDWIINAGDYISRNSWVESWFNGGFRMFVSLQEGADLQVVQERVLNEVNEATNYDADERILLQKYTDTYLFSTFENGMPVTGRIQYVRILFIMAVFILLIACINFTNLSIARSSKRAREIGVRKVIGASKSSLGSQFLTESFLVSLFSVLVAVLVVMAILPLFNSITGKTLILDFTNSRLWIGLVMIAIVTGLLSGAYPALLQSSFKITSSLRGNFKHSVKGSLLRNGLVVFQFAISILMISGTIVVSRQMEYVMTKNLGLDKENMLYTIMEGDLRGKSDVFRIELQNIPEVSSVTTTSGNPISYGSSTGGAMWDGKDPNDVVEINVLSVGVHFAETMGVEVIRGRNFSEEIGTDTSNYLINEVTADIMGFDDPVEQNLTVWGQKGKVVGVVKNFHMDSMYESIAPLIIRYDPNSTRMAFIKIRNDIPNAIQEIEKVTKSMNPAFPFRYNFMDEDYAQQYQSEMRISTVSMIFAFVSIFISCLGLLGLSSYTTDQRSREIGIRKVHGAGTPGLIMTLSRNYAALMIIAFVLAAPASYFLLQQWLNDFVFRIDMNPGIYIVAGLIAFAIGALTVGLKSYQAARINPVRTLKAE